MSHDRDLRATLERIAAEENMDPDELLAEAERTAEPLDRHVPKPHTAERMCRYIADVDGLTHAEYDDLLAAVQRSMTTPNRGVSSVALRGRRNKPILRW